MRGVGDRRITIVRIIDRLNVGGPAIHVALTTRGLDPTRFRTVLIHGNVEDSEADMGYLLDGADIERIVIPSLGRELRPFRDLKTLWQLYRTVKHIEPDIVHTHKAKAGAIGRVVAILAGVPVRIHTFHGHVFEGYFGAAKTSIFVAIERALARITTRLVALSDGLVDNLVHRWRIGSADQFAVVPLGFDLRPFVDAQRYRGALRGELAIGEDIRLIGIVGRMVPVKDHRTFVEAAARVARSRPDTHFVFIGGGELEEEISAQLKSRGLSERSHLLGWRRQLEKIYPDLDVLALSSVNEGTPVTLVEAMSVGVPVVATAVGGVPDILEHGRNGELVPPRDPDALASALLRALEPAARVRADRIRGDITERFGRERLFRDLSNLYERALGNAR